VKKVVAHTLTASLLVAATLTVPTMGMSAATEVQGSPGCGASSVEPGRGGGTIESAGLERRWALRVPSMHDGVTPLPLLIQLHGYTGNPTFQDSLSGFELLGDELGFVTASPNGRGSSVERWVFELDAVEIDTTPSNPDAIFIADLIERLGDELCLDPSRVYLTGFSNGAEGVSALACALEDRIAAFAPVSGFLDFGGACELDRLVPILVIHGTADPFTLFEGGHSDLNLGLPTDLPGVPFGDLPVVDNPAFAVSLPDRVAAFAARNGCDPTPATEIIGASVERISYTCPEGAEVEFIVAEGDGHTWPGTPFPPRIFGPVTKEVEASRLIWEFFAAHPMPGG
jgi:polyhydroxybutyrate depolymerase